jgi:hypothetical protein
MMNIPIVPAARETETGGLLEPKSSRLARIISLPHVPKKVTAKKPTNILVKKRK